MQTQNTPVHVGLWHRDFWLLAVASLLVTTAMYLLLPLLPRWMMAVCGCTPVEAAVCVALPGAAAFLLGCFCSYLVQRYRRNHVCVYSLFAIAMCFYCLQFIHRGVGTALGAFGFVAVVRLVQGAMFGLAQMVLSSTLVIDSCESSKRTEANYSAAWFTRFALSLGPMLALALLPVMDFGSVMVVGAMLCIVAVILISAVKFPFKAPEDIVRHISADRFFLPQGKWLFVNLLLVMAAVGLIFTIGGTILFLRDAVCRFPFGPVGGTLCFRQCRAEERGCGRTCAHDCRIARASVWRQCHGVVTVSGPIGVWYWNNRLTFPSVFHKAQSAL